MLKLWKSAAFALGGVSVALAVPAQARDRYYDRGGGDDAAIAIGAGVVGLALGAALASNNRDRDYYYEDDYYQPREIYYQSYPRYYQNYEYRSYPRHYRRGYNGWRGDRHHGWGRGDRSRRHDRHWRY